MQHSAAFGIALRDGFEAPSFAGMTLAQACAAAVTAVETHVQHSAGVRSYLQGIIDAQMPFCPSGCDAEELAKFLATGSGTVDVSDPELLERYTDVLLLALERFRSEVIEKALRTNPAWADALALVRAATAVSESFTRLWRRWHQLVATPFQKLPVPEREKLGDELKDVLDKYDYSVVTQDGRRSSWASLMSTTVMDVLAALGDLRTPLVVANFAAGGDAVDAEKYEAYLDALAAALGQPDVTKLDDAWAAVDRRWAELPAGAFVPVHGMENGEHPFCVSPSFKMMLRVSTEADVRMIADHKKAIVEVLPDLELDEAAVAAAKRKIDRSDAGVFLELSQGGADLNNRIMGQVLPNRQEIMADGGRIFLQPPHAAAQSAATYAEQIRTFCTPETAAVLAPLITADLMTTSTVAHELFHPVGRSLEIDAGLGATQELHEEAKATMGGHLGSRRASGGATDAGMVAMTLARICRFMHDSRRKSRGYEPYVRENLVALQALIDARVLRVGIGGLSVDLSEERVNQWYEFLRGYTYCVLNGYRNVHAEALRQLRLIHCGAQDEGASQTAASVIALVNLKK